MYKKSKDYEKLWELINQGHRIAGWVVNKHGNLSIVEIKLGTHCYSIGSKGVGYGMGSDSDENFYIDCASFELEYILPHE